MTHSLALANIAHRKVRAAASISAVCMGITMLITMLGLSHGTLEEVADRVSSVNAELLVLPEGRSIIFTSGAPLSHKYQSIIENVKVDGTRAVERAIPTFFHQVHLGGQEQKVFGVDRDEFKFFLGSRKWVAGRLYDEGDRFKKLIDSKRSAQGGYDPESLTDAEVQLGCEMVVDDRLAKAGKYHVGQQVEYMGRQFTIVGIFQAGAAGRVFVPIQILRHIQNAGIPWSSIYFVRLNEAIRHRGDAAISAAAEAIAKATRLRVIEKAAYERLLYQSFGQIYVFINFSSVVVLIFAVFFILLTTYTMVLERTREIGILKSLGAGRLFLIRQSVSEALVLSVTGTILGIGLAYAAKYGVERFQPLLTVDVAPRFLLLAIAVGLVAGVFGSIYPAYRVTRLDPAVALSFD
jgi:putative ABC transport system permease protein